MRRCRVRHGRLVTLLAFALLAGLVASPALAYRFGSSVRQLGPEQTVFDWSRDRCDDLNIPDSVPRAYRDAQNEVQLTISHYINRRMTGPSLDHLAVNCGVTLSSDMSADPATYDDREWIHSPFTFDGQNVYAVVHEEFEGWTHPGMCTSSVFQDCWFNSLTLATSTDGGATYTQTAPPTHLIASMPYTYSINSGPLGYFTPTNIILSKTDGYFYMMARAEKYQAQAEGTCVLRTNNLADPSSWRAWDGSGFTIQFVNPYTDSFRARDHVCPPVANNQIEKMSQSLTWNTFFGKWLLVGTTATDHDVNAGIAGFSYSTSSDLIHWSSRKVFMYAKFPWTYQCGDDDPINYPAVLDPKSPTRNFSITGQRGYIYFTHFHYSNCNQTLNRDLVRVPFEFLGRRAPITPPPLDY